eukprot:SAG11_NODE_1703_length_4420_cov_1.855589_2_plen_175_part_00
MSAFPIKIADSKVTTIKELKFEITRLLVDMENPDIEEAEFCSKQEEVQKKRKQLDKESYEQDKLVWLPFGVIDTVLVDPAEDLCKLRSSQKANAAHVYQADEHPESAAHAAESNHWRNFRYAKEYVFILHLVHSIYVRVDVACIQCFSASHGLRRGTNFCDLRCSQLFVVWVRD